MSIKLTKLNKDSLSIVDQVEISLDYANGMTISHFTDITVTSQKDLTFSFKTLPKNVPILQDEEYIVVIREKVNLSDNTSNEISTKKNGKVVGKKNYNNAIPYSHPNGIAMFTELKGKN